MKYKIGDIVKHDSLNTWIVVATKENALTSKYLDDLDGDLKIKGINEIACSGIAVSSGFEYVIKKILSFDNGCAFLDDGHEQCFEEDIWR